MSPPDSLAWHCDSGGRINDLHRHRKELICPNLERITPHRSAKTRGASPSKSNKPVGSAYWKARYDWPQTGGASDSLRRMRWVVWRMAASVHTSVISIW